MVKGCKINVKCITLWITEDIKFIKISETKRLLMVNKYTFAPTTPGHFYCSKKAKGCKARIFMNTDQTLVTYADNEHNHEPPVYVMAAGYYVKLN